MKTAFLLLLLTLFPALAEEKWTPLFNGVDFTNWGGAGKTEHVGYYVNDGEIHATPACRFLTSDREYKHYRFRFEFKLTPGANNGLGIHYPGTGDPAYTGMEIQMLDNTAEKFADLKDWQYHGSLYTLAAAKKGHLKPVGAWNLQEVIVAPDHTVRVLLNGTEILKTDLKKARKAHPKHQGAKRQQGHLVFCGHKDIISLRNLQIQELTKADPKPAKPAEPKKAEPETR